MNEGPAGLWNPFFEVGIFKNRLNLGAYKNGMLEISTLKGDLISC